MWSHHLQGQNQRALTQYLLDQRWCNWWQIKIKQVFITGNMLHNRHPGRKSRVAPIIPGVLSKVSKSFFRGATKAGFFDLSVQIFLAYCQRLGLKAFSWALKLLSVTSLSHTFFTLLWALKRLLKDGLSFLLIFLCAFFSICRHSTTFSICLVLLTISVVLLFLGWFGCFPTSYHSRCTLNKD